MGPAASAEGLHFVSRTGDPAHGGIFQSRNRKGPVKLHDDLRVTVCRGRIDGCRIVVNHFVSRILCFRLAGRTVRSLSLGLPRCRQILRADGPKFLIQTSVVPDLNGFQGLGRRTVQVLVDNCHFVPDHPVIERYRITEGTVRCESHCLLHGLPAVDHTSHNFIAQHIRLGNTLGTQNKVHLIGSACMHRGHDRIAHGFYCAV